jgi:hypothetical protein
MPTCPGLLLLIFFYFGLFNQYSRNEPGQNFFSKSGPFESHQSDWHDLWRSHAMCTEATHEAGACQVIGVAPHTRQSCRMLWRDSPVVPTSLVWLSRVVCYGMTGGPAILRHVSTSCARVDGATGGKIEHAWASSSYLSFLFLSFSLSLSHARRGKPNCLTLCRHRSPPCGTVPLPSRS